jgi:hypothetical protein
MASPFHFEIIPEIDSCRQPADAKNKQDYFDENLLFQ